MCAWRSAPPRSARSAPGSPSWSGRARAHTGPATTARSAPSRRAGSNSSPDRAGTKKRRSTGPVSVRGMELTLRNTFLEVDDHDAALAFYRDTLGLEVRQDVATEYGRWLTVGPQAQPEISIVLQTAGVGRPPEDGQTIKELLAKGSLSGLVFETDDVDGMFERVAASGAEVLQEPMDMPYGVRDCAFRDPAGNMVRFNQPKG